MKLAWQQQGESGRRTVLFLHGFMGSGSDWLPVCRQLKSRFLCLLPDLPGHGGSSELPARFSCSMEECAGAVIGLLDELEVPDCALVGYSMGGRLALYLLLNYPQRFSRVLLASASPGLSSEENRRKRRRLDEERARRLECGDFPRFLREWYDQPLFASLKKHPGFESLFQRRLENQPRALAASLRGMGTGSQPSLWAALRQNKIPLRLLAGEFDFKFRRLAAEMAEACPVAEVRNMKGAGHTIHFEQPEAFAGEIIDFLDREEENP